MTIIVTTSMTCKVRESILDIVELIERRYNWFELELAEGEDAGKKLVIKKKYDSIFQRSIEVIE